MLNSVEVSVIVPIYNVAPYLEKGIISILNQSFRNFELVCIDDGSTDNSLEVIKKLSSQDSRINVYSKKNSGVGDTRNFGLKLAKGKYIYFFDPDDFVDPKLLYDNYTLIEKTNAEVILFGFYECIDNEIKSTKVNRKNQIIDSNQQFGQQYPELYQENAMYVCWNKLYLKDFLLGNNLSFTNQRTGQDAIFNLEVFKILERICINGQAYYYYVLNRQGSAQTNYRNEMMSDDLRIIKKSKKLLSYWQIDYETFLMSIMVDILYKNVKKRWISTKGNSAINRIRLLKELFSQDNVLELLTSINPLKLQNKNKVIKYLVVRGAFFSSNLSRTVTFK